MKFCALLLSLWFAFGLTGSPLSENASAAFDAANRLLAQGHAQAAAQAYEAVLPAGTTSVALERNWAQACYQSQLPGVALLHLRRAERLDPRDESVRADLELLRTRLGGTRIAMSELSFLRLDEWAWLALIATWFWFTLLFAARLSPRCRSAWHGFGFGAGLVALLLGGLLVAAFTEQAHAPDAIVLAGDTPVHQSPLEEAKVTFTLPAAAELRVRDTKDGWLLVEDPAAPRFGWLKLKQVGRVAF